MNSRKKGKHGELELAAFLRERGVEARRGQQFHGGAGSPDVVSAFPHVHFEGKRVEAGNPYDWLDQCQRDGGEGKIHVVAHRRNNRKWIAIMPLDELIELLKRDVTFVMETKHEDQ
jgi:hypothetical protein